MLRLSHMAYKVMCYVPRKQDFLQFSSGPAYGKLNVKVILKIRGAFNYSDKILLNFRCYPPKKWFYSEKHPAPVENVCTHTHC